MPIQPLKVSDNRRYLLQEDGTPFFWLGDTAWELFHCLTREEADLYLANRAELGYTVIQAVALAERDGLGTPNAYGRQPLLRNSAGEYDPTLPDTEGEYSYWSHVDYIVGRAASLGLYIAFLPTWGDKFHPIGGVGPSIFNELNAKVYGTWLGKRYRERNNIIWVLGGDRILQTAKHFAVNSALAYGLRAGDGGRHLITLHPHGDSSSSRSVHEELWLDFNMIQSGHGDLLRSNYRHVGEDYARQPIKPTLDAEPCYEDHPVGFKAANGYFDEADVRIGAYYAVFAGAFGHTYGHNAIWSMTVTPDDYFIMDWKTALKRPGAAQMQHLRKLIEQHSFLDRVPDQSLIVANYSGANYMVATRGGDYALIYSPNGLAFDAALGKLAAATAATATTGTATTAAATTGTSAESGAQTTETITASWYDPRTGEYSKAWTLPMTATARFTPPSSGRGNDWVLVLHRISLS